MTEYKISNLLKSYNDNIVLAIDDLSFLKGEFVGIIGNNGAGKSTLLKLMLDLAKPDKGSVLFRTENVSKTEQWKRYVGSYLDNSFLIDFLMPEEYFKLIADCYRLNTGELAFMLERMKDFMRDEVMGRKKLIRDFSAGNKQKIGIIGALLSKPDVLILDEPFNFLDPGSQYFIKNHLKSWQEEFKTTVILSSHNIDAMLDLCSRIILIEKGKIQKDEACISETDRLLVKRAFMDKLI